MQKTTNTLARQYGECITKIVVMKLLSLIFSFICVVVLSSSMSLSRTSPTVGSEAPDFAVFNKTNSIRPADFKGKYITLNFWSAKDAGSRERNQRLAAECRAAGQEFVGICVDDDRSLAREIIAQDGLDATQQYMVADVRKGDPAGSYEIHNGLRAFEINPFGNIERVID